MISVLRNGALVLATILFSIVSTARAQPVFTDAFSTAHAYTAGTAGEYTVKDENDAFKSTWTAGGGLLTYSRPPSDTDPNGYRYNSSVFLSAGLSPATGSTVGLVKFVVKGSIHGIFADNTAQPGLIVSASIEEGGYLLAVDNQRGGHFALLSVSGSELMADEGSGGAHHVVHEFLNPVQGHDYGLSVTVDRSGAHPAFDVAITDLGVAGSTVRYVFSDPTRDSTFGGTQIGYRVRNPLDGQRPTFGALSLTVVPEPTATAFCALAIASLLLRPDRSTRRVARTLGSPSTLR
jgi:hypothetical protein